jgi:hypothetical protein
MNWFFDFWKPLVKNIYTHSYSRVIYRLQKRENCPTMEMITAKHFAQEDCGDDDIEFCQWRWQMECTMDHIDSMLFFGGLRFWLWGYRMKLYRFLYRQTLTSVVTIEWCCIHSMESWCSNHWCCTHFMESWCSNHAASVLQKPKSTITIWWIFDFKVCQVMLKICISHSFKQRILLHFPSPHWHWLPFSWQLIVQGQTLIKQ